MSKVKQPAPAKDIPQHKAMAMGKKPPIEKSPKIPA
jgi:hypothetical protein